MQDEAGSDNGSAEATQPQSGRADPLGNFGGDARFVLAFGAHGMHMTTDAKPFLSRGLDLPIFAQRRNEDHVSPGFFMAAARDDGLEVGPGLSERGKLVPQGSWIFVHRGHPDLLVFCFHFHICPFAFCG